MTKRILCVLVSLFALATPAAAQSQDGLLLHGALATYAMAAWIDGVGTAYCSGQGVCHEVNPALRPIVERHGTVAAMTVKGGMHIIIGSLIVRDHHDHPKRAFWTAMGLGSAQILVDVANYRTLNKGKP